MARLGRIVTELEAITTAEIADSETRSRIVALERAWLGLRDSVEEAAIALFAALDLASARRMADEGRAREYAYAPVIRVVDLFPERLRQLSIAHVDELLRVWTKRGRNAPGDRAKDDAIADALKAAGVHATALSVATWRKAARSRTKKLGM